MYFLHRFFFLTCCIFVFTSSAFAYQGYFDRDAYRERSAQSHRSQAPQQSYWQKVSQNWQDFWAGRQGIVSKAAYVSLQVSKATVRESVRVFVDPVGYARKFPFRAADALQRRVEAIAPKHVTPAVKAVARVPVKKTDIATKELIDARSPRLHEEHGVLPHVSAGREYARDSLQKPCMAEREDMISFRQFKYDRAIIEPKPQSPSLGQVISDAWQRTANRLHGYGAMTDREFAVDKRLAVMVAQQESITGALVFSVGKGAVQQITRFGERSTMGEKALDATKLGNAMSMGAYVLQYMAKAFMSKDAVPHHVGMAFSERQPNGRYETYVMQINPEGQTMVKFTEFAANELTVKIVQPEKYAVEIGEYWRKTDYDEKMQDKSGRTYDYARLIGIDTTGDAMRGRKTAICSEDVYFRAADFVNDKRSKGENISINDVFPGVVKDARITPNDFYATRDTWDRDAVKEFAKRDSYVLQRVQETVRYEEEKWKREHGNK
jgi:hypothetical protein